jgi:hypothetical protein
MRRFLRYLKAAWLYSQFVPYVEAADAEGFWTADDARKLYQFFQSQTGQKLSHRLRNYAIQAASSAVRNPTNSSYHNGVAAGIPMLIVAIENHFIGGEPDAENEQADTTAFDTLEQNA